MRNQPPNLRNLATVPASVLQALPAVPRDGVELFLIITEGTHDGVRYAVGELIVCRGEARDGDITVLVPKGHGKPRLGRIDGTRLRGDGDEPCHPARWGSAGRVVARYRRESAGWIIELQEARAQRTVAASESETVTFEVPESEEPAAPVRTMAASEEDVPFPIRRSVTPAAPAARVSKRTRKEATAPTEPIAPAKPPKPSKSSAPSPLPPPEILTEPLTEPLSRPAPSSEPAQLTLFATQRSRQR